MERYNIEENLVQLVGYAPDTVIAFNVDTAYVRPKDRALSKKAFRGNKEAVDEGM